MYTITVNEEGNTITVNEKIDEQILRKFIINKLLSNKNFDPHALTTGAYPFVVQSAEIIVGYILNGIKSDT
jgi:hypothetical protein